MWNQRAPVPAPPRPAAGLASCAGSHEGVAAIYHIKRRQLNKPLAICVADPGDVARYAHTEVGPHLWPEQAAEEPWGQAFGRAFAVVSRTRPHLSAGGGLGCTILSGLLCYRPGQQVSEQVLRPPVFCKWRLCPHRGLALGGGEDVAVANQCPCTLAFCRDRRKPLGALAPLQHLAEGLVEDLLPGPVTLLLLRKADAPLAPELNLGVEAVGTQPLPFVFTVCLTAQER
jgi:hypothetical protein